MNTNVLTTYCIYANVSEWRYAYDQPQPGVSSIPATPRLHFYVITEDNGIIPKALPLGFCIVYDTDDVDNVHSPWQLDLMKEMNDPPIPRYLEGLLTLAEAPFLALKEALFLTAKSNDCYIRLHLAVQELPPNEFAERSFAIVEFGYTLHHQKENK